MEVDLDEGEAILQIKNFCRVFDAFTVPNSGNPAHPLGLVSAIIDSLRIHWRGVKMKRSFNNGFTFRGNFVETSATIDVTVTTPPTNPPFTPSPQHGFKFVADPTSTIADFAQFGHEGNGSLF